MKGFSKLTPALQKLANQRRLDRQQTEAARKDSLVRRELDRVSDTDFLYVYGVGSSIVSTTRRLAMDLVIPPTCHGGDVAVPAVTLPLRRLVHLCGADGGLGQRGRCLLLTGQPSTRVAAAPGGGSSLGYLFGDGSK